MAEKKSKKSVAGKRKAPESIFVRIPGPLLHAIEQYRDAAGMQTTGEAIRQLVREELIRRGLFKMPEGKP